MGATRLPCAIFSLYYRCPLLSPRYPLVDCYERTFLPFAPLLTTCSDLAGPVQRGLRAYELAMALIRARNGSNTTGDPIRLLSLCRSTSSVTRLSFIRRCDALSRYSSNFIIAFVLLLILLVRGVVCTDLWEVVMFSNEIQRK